MLLPACALAGLSPIQLEAILAHELAHIRRGDFLVNLLQSLVEVLLFYHPAVWWLSARIRAERELCCATTWPPSSAAIPCSWPAPSPIWRPARAPGPIPTHLALAANGGSSCTASATCSTPPCPSPPAPGPQPWPCSPPCWLGARGRRSPGRQGSTAAACLPPPSLRSKTLRFRTVEDNRTTAITLKGEVKATPAPGTPSCWARTAASVEETQAGKTRAYRRDAKGRAYTVDGQEKPLDAEGESWLREVAEVRGEGAQAREGSHRGGPSPGREGCGGPREAHPGGSPRGPGLHGHGGRGRDRTARRRPGPAPEGDRGPRQGPGPEPEEPRRTPRTCPRRAPA
ncbi:MAG: M56 family metallopeptidase [Holophagaceae bacterium]|uniref:M56 family metallopeptidase n=1 Tax=Candidatus Geothrix odensensis TaxID=2954440 RepID=A0A936F418_9BACT|nr:M56 family metallopeptidase [Candidatus Geothrix odensensis]